VVIAWQADVDVDEGEVMDDRTRHGVTDVPIRDSMIRLGQFLKLAGAVESGADVKQILALDDVTVNGDVEQRRGRQLVRGDEVTLGGSRFRVA
jgi:ribosome-associated protein